MKKGEVRSSIAFLTHFSFSVGIFSQFFSHCCHYLGILPTFIYFVLPDTCEKKDTLSIIIFETDTVLVSTVDKQMNKPTATLTFHSLELFIRFFIYFSALWLCRWLIC